MKSILFALLFLPVIGRGQVYKFRTIKAKVTFADPAMAKGTVDTLWKQVDMLVVVNDDTKKIKIYSSNPVNLDIAAIWKSNYEKGILTIPYDCVDEKGRDCKVFMVFYNDETGQTISTMNLVYPKYTLSYRLKDTEK
jgi:hypothetical protein